MAERGDMFVNRKRPNVLVRSLIPLFTGFGQSKCFTPTRLLTEHTIDHNWPEAKVLSPRAFQGIALVLTVAG